MEWIPIDSFRLLILVLLAFLVFLYFYLKKIGSRHYKNVRKVDKVLRKLNDPKSTFHDAQKMNYLKKIDPFVFEELLLTSFQNRGYKIKRNKRYTGDVGIDGIIYNDKGDKILVQAKRYANHINPMHVSFNRTILELKF